MLLLTANLELVVTDMFEYNIAKEADNTKFLAFCQKIESNIAGITKEPLLTDVDGTQIQIYNTKAGKIKVYNDYEVDAVYADSEFELLFS